MDATESNITTIIIKNDKSQSNDDDDDYNGWLSIKFYSTPS